MFEVKRDYVPYLRLVEVTKPINPRDYLEDGELWSHLTPEAWSNQLSYVLDDDQYNYLYKEGCRRIKIGLGVVASRKRRQLMMEQLLAQDQQIAAETFISPPQILPEAPINWPEESEIASPPSFLSKLKNAVTESKHLALEGVETFGRCLGFIDDGQKKNRWVTSAIGTISVLGTIGVIFASAHVDVPAPPTQTYNPDQFKTQRFQQPTAGFLKPLVTAPVLLSRSESQIKTNQVQNNLQADQTAVIAMVSADRGEWHIDRILTESKEPQFEEIIVQPGDTLWDLTNGDQDQIQRIVEANPEIINPDVIIIGQHLKIPLPDPA